MRCAVCGGEAHAWPTVLRWTKCIEVVCYPCWLWLLGLHDMYIWPAG